MATNCSWCGKNIGFFDLTSSYELIDDTEYFICSECSVKISAAERGKTTFERIKTAQTNPELFDYYTEQEITPEEAVQQKRVKKEQQRIKKEFQQTNPLYDDIHQIAGDLRFIKNFLIFCIVSGIIFGFVLLISILL